jgi:hypothetical protein
MDFCCWRRRREGGREGGRGAWHPYRRSGCGSGRKSRRRREGGRAWADPSSL